jgi:hypothetical protein
VPTEEHDAIVSHGFERVKTDIGVAEPAGAMRARPESYRKSPSVIGR